MPRPRRNWRQQARQTTEPAAELADTDRRRVARVLAGITQAEANPTPDLATVHVQVPAQFPTPWTLPVALLAADAVLPDDLKPLLPPVDDNNDLLARARDGAAGLPLASFQRLVLACVVVLCRRGTCGNLYHSSGFAAGKEEAIEGWDSALHRERDVHHPFERDLDILRGHAFFLQFSLQPGV